MSLYFTGPGYEPALDVRDAMRGGIEKLYSCASFRWRIAGDWVLDLLRPERVEPKLRWNPLL